jgi:hypothetical protein
VSGVDYVPLFSVDMNTGFREEHAGSYVFLGDVERGTLTREINLWYQTFDDMITRFR